MPYTKTLIATVALAFMMAGCHAAPGESASPGHGAPSAAGASSSAAHPTPVAAPTSTVQWLTGDGYSLSIPITWMQDSSPQSSGFDLAYRSAPEGGQTFQAIRPADPEGATSVDGVRDQYKKKLGLGILAADYKELGTTTVGGERTNRFAATDPRSQRKVVGAYCLHDGRVYFITYGGPTSDEARLRALLDATVASWKWTH